MSKGWPFLHLEYMISPVFLSRTYILDIETSANPCDVGANRWGASKAERCSRINPSNLIRAIPA
ncbi:hypothetical protein NBRC116597_12900 [Phaeobacter sp. NW0010-22]